LWQAIAGAWPADRARLRGYAEKAAREAGTSTTWTDPDQEFEQKLLAAVDAVFDDPDVRTELMALVARIDPHGASNSLSAKLVQLTMPGVPDIYQGTEFWDRSLADPDNRRAVDFERRRAALTELDDGQLPAVLQAEACKLLVTSRALRLRRDRPELFRGYKPVQAEGTAADHLIAFSRADSTEPATAGAMTFATRLPYGLERKGGWRDTAVVLDTEMQDGLTGTVFGPGPVEVADILRVYPVALLFPASQNG
jgi:(1->4)-alpha-D-glucan 1-alpha-D-glucosylmutase